MRAKSKKLRNYFKCITNTIRNESKETKNTNKTYEIADELIHKFSSMQLDI